MPIISAFRLLTLATAIASAAVLSASAQSTAPQADAVGGQAATASPVELNGFRTARFGMDEAAIRKAILTDFALDKSKIGSVENPAERTRILSVKVPDVLDGGGIADVSYVFGHTSKKLTQVSVLWSGQSDPSLDGEKLLANGNVLRSYFLSAGYVPASVVTDVPVPEGLLLFRGSDAKGRMAVLLLRGTYAAAAPVEGAANPAPPVLTPAGLLLAYIENPQKPDVFTVKPGQF